jgi:aconitate hydratase
MLLIQLSMIEPSKTKRTRGYCVIAGDNFAQGSSREHAALAPKYLVKSLLSQSYARIGWQNLINLVLFL